MRRWSLTNTFTLWIAINSTTAIQSTSTQSETHWRDLYQGEREGEQREQLCFLSACLTSQSISQATYTLNTSSTMKLLWKKILAIL